MDPKIIQFAIVLVFVPAAVIGYILLIEQVLRFISPKRQPSAATVAVAGAGVPVPDHLPHLPDGPDDHPQPVGQARNQLRGTRQLPVRLQQFG